MIILILVNMYSIEETIDRLNSLYLEDNIEDDYIDRIKKQQQLLLDIVANSMLDQSIDVGKINFIYDKAISSIDAYLKGDVSMAITHIASILEQKDNGKFVYLRHSTFFNRQEVIGYRTRKNETYDLFSKEEMMHIPNHKRYLINNQRYSLSGYPCLYFGASIYVCWEELYRPNIDKFNVTCIRNEELIQFADLTLPYFNADNFNKEYLYTSIFPWLCSFKARHKGSAFIEEYIIPQMLMSALMNFRKRGRGGINELMAFQGIMYTSTTYNTDKDLFKDIKLMTNYVVPILGDKINSCGLCEYVCDYFSLTQPTSLTNERVVAEQGGIIMYDGDKQYSKYEMTEFGQLEEKLKAREFQKIE